jgi:hypothetical protein
MLRAQTFIVLNGFVFFYVDSIVNDEILIVLIEKLHFTITSISGFHKDALIMV